MYSFKTKKLISIAQKLLAPGKGILAADERPDSLTSRFKKHGIDNNESTRHLFRYHLFRMATNQVSGVILHEETFAQKTFTPDEGVFLTDILQKKGILLGLKADNGLLDLHDEKVSYGLEDLRDRLEKKEYEKVSFLKWRSVFTIGRYKPSQDCIVQNCNVLARYASIAQQYEKVPIVEPEILWEGGCSMEEHYYAALKVLSELVAAFHRKGVYLPGVIIKMGFVCAGPHSEDGNDVTEAEATLSVAGNALSATIPGIVFLSGGHSAEDSMRMLDEVNKLNKSGERSEENRIKGIISNDSRRFTFSYGRALTDPFLEVWKGDDKNVDKARRVFLEGLERCSKASMGEL